MGVSFRLDVGKLLVAFFCGATFAFWCAPLFVDELSTWQSIELQIGIGSTVAVLYCLKLFVESEMKVENKGLGLTPEEEIEYREGLEEKARKKAQKK